LQNINGSYGSLTTTSVPREKILRRLFEASSGSFSSFDVQIHSRELLQVSHSLTTIPEHGSSGAGCSKTIANEITVFPNEKN